MADPWMKSDYESDKQMSALPGPARKIDFRDEIL